MTPLSPFRRHREYGPYQECATASPLRHPTGTDFDRERARMTAPRPCSHGYIIYYPLIVITTRVARWLPAEVNYHG